MWCSFSPALAPQPVRGLEREWTACAIGPCSTSCLICRTNSLRRSASTSVWRDRGCSALASSAHRALGAGWFIQHTSGFGLALDATRTVGRATHTVSCANVSHQQAPIANCVGDGEEGVVDTTIATAKAQYYFRRSRVQPYVSGGAALYQDSLLIVNNVQPFPNRPPFALQSLGRHRGMAVVAGGGLRVGGRLASLRPDVTLYKSGRWTHVRASVGAAFGW